MFSESFLRFTLCSAGDLVLVEKDRKVSRVPGLALYFSDNLWGLPEAFTRLTTKLPAVHQTVVFVTVRMVGSAPLASLSRHTSLESAEQAFKAPSADSWHSCCKVQASEGSRPKWDPQGMLRSMQICPRKRQAVPDRGQSRASRSADALCSVEASFWYVQVPLPTTSADERFLIRPLQLPGFFRVIARYG